MQNMADWYTLGANRCYANELKGEAMTELEAIVARHSVRQYEDRPLAEDVVATLQAAVDEANEASGLHIQLVTNEPGAFGKGLAHYGKFRGVSNYFAICGPKGAEAEELAGYYGEKLVLLAQTLGLNTCWVALTFSKRAARFELAAGERLIIMIALGYGATQGVAHRSVDARKVARADGEVPEWFANGVAAALLAPTAMNQQRFRFTLVRPGVEGEPPRVQATAPHGVQTKVDLGIVRYHFEVGAGKENFIWA